MAYGGSNDDVIEKSCNSILRSITLKTLWKT